MTKRQLDNNTKWQHLYQLMRALVLNDVERDFLQHKRMVLESFTRKFLSDVIRCKECSGWFLRVKEKENRCDECGGTYGSTATRRAANRKDRAKHSLRSLP